MHRHCYCRPSVFYTRFTPKPSPEIPHTLSFLFVHRNIYYLVKKIIHGEQKKKLLVRPGKNHIHTFNLIYSIVNTLEKFCTRFPAVTLKIPKTNQPVTIHLSLPPYKFSRHNDRNNNKKRGAAVQWRTPNNQQIEKRREEKKERCDGPSVYCLPHLPHRRVNTRLYGPHRKKKCINNNNEDVRGVSVEANP